MSTETDRVATTGESLQDEDFKALDRIKQRITWTVVEGMPRPAPKQPEDTEVEVRFLVALECSSEEFNANLPEGISWKNYRIPSTQQNLLHFALQNDKIDKAEILMTMADEKFLTESCFDPATRLYGKENILHLITKKHVTSLARSLTVSQDAFRKLMREETPMAVGEKTIKGLPCLHLAAFLGHEDLVTFFLEKEGDVNLQSGSKDTALLWAARQGHDNIVSLLLNKGADPDLVNNDTVSALHAAVRRGRTDIVQMLADHKADVNCRRDMGLMCPVVLASALGHVDILKILLDRGANYNFEARGKDRPLHYAAQEGHVEVASLLLDRGAELEASNIRGHTALTYAAKYDQARVLKLLIDKGAKVKHRNKKGRDVWYYAVRLESDSLLKTLLQAWREKKIEGRPMELLTYAVERCNCDRIALILDAIVDSNTTDNAQTPDVSNISDDEGNTILHHAARHDKHEVITKFAERLRVDTQNNSGHTALQLACEQGHHEAVQALLEVGANATVENKRKQTALHMLAAAPSAKGVTVTALIAYILNHHAREDLQRCDAGGQTPFHVAARYGSPEVIRAFSLAGVQHVDIRGNLPLHLAVRKGQPEVLKAMLDVLEKSAEWDKYINAQNGAKDRVIHLAAAAGFHELIPRLVDMNADLTGRGAEGDTVVHRLVRCMVEDPDMQEEYMKVFEAVLNEYIKQIKNSSPYKSLRRKAFVDLCREIKNTDGYSCMQLAFEQRATWFLEYLFNLDGVLRVQEEDCDWFDVTDLMVGDQESGMTLLSDYNLPDSGENILDIKAENVVQKRNGPPKSAGDPLDISPISDLERMYGTMVMIVCSIMLVLHLIYISVFTYVGVVLLQATFQGRAIRIESPPRILFYIIVPIEPVVILAWVRSSWKDFFCKCCTGRHWLKIVRASLSYLFALVYVAAIAVWFVQHLLGFAFQEYALAVALCLGWLLTVALTRGFRNYHIWQMLQVMILKDFIRFFIVYIFVLMGFSMALYCLFQPSSTLTADYTAPLDTIFLLARLLFGSGDLFDDDFKAAMNAVGRSQTASKIFYSVYMILAFLVLLNVLIAMLNSSYTNITKRRNLQWRYETLRLGLSMECFPLARKIPRTRRKVTTESAGSKNDRHVSSTWKLQ